MTDMDAALSTIRESDIEKHLPVAQSLVTNFTQVVTGKAESKTALAGTRRRFVSTVATGQAKSTNKVEFTKTVSAISEGDHMLSLAQHGLVWKMRRGIAVALAVVDQFAEQTGLDALTTKNVSGDLSGGDAENFRNLVESSAYIAAFSAAAYLLQMSPEEGEPASDVPEPDFLFDTPQDALKGLVAAVDAAVDGAADDKVLTARARAAARLALGRIAAAAGAVYGARRVREHASAVGVRRLRTERLRRRTGREALETRHAVQEAE